MNGRDLIRPYVDACRKYGLKVGFYYSPRDWGNDEYYFPYLDHDYDKKWEVPKLEPAESQAKFEIFYDMVVGQLSELLTNYGKIDVLWFDGVEWPDVNTHTGKMHAWLREIQPGMVVNPRWDTNDESKSFGDFKTEEYSWRKHMGEPPAEAGEWWEFCESWSGHWGFSPMKEFIPLSDMIKLLVHARSYGGNYLINIGPAPDGTMRKGFYDECVKLARWMEKNRESVIGTNPVMDWKEKCNYPMTKTENALYIHLLNDTVSKISISGIKEPVSAILLETGEKLYVEKSGGEKFSIDLKNEVTHPLDAVIKLEY
jgi:alpha-L-fucosidase